MNKEQSVVGSAYRQIAIDIAKNIANGQYAEEQKLFGRSVLASHYKVSPETIRKAVHLLKDVEILDTEKGSGIKVKSVKKAKEFIGRYNDVESIISAKNEITSWARRQAKESAEMIDKIQFVVNMTERMKNLSPFVPFEISITDDCAVIGKTLNELQFWHNTGGTVIAIKRDERLIISPEPYAAFCEDDIFYIIGSEQSYIAAKKLLFG